MISQEKTIDDLHKRFEDLLDYLKMGEMQHFYAKQDLMAQLSDARETIQQLSKSRVEIKDLRHYAAKYAIEINGEKREFMVDQDIENWVFYIGSYADDPNGITYRLKRDTVLPELICKLAELTVSTTISIANFEFKLKALESFVEAFKENGMKKLDEIITDHQQKIKRGEAQLGQLI